MLTSIMNPLKGMYHESKDVSLIKGCIITFHMFYDSIVNRFWSPSHIYSFSFFHLITRDKTLKELEDLCI